MKITYHPYQLELKEPFVISHGTFHYRDSLIVEIEHNGIHGFGEATAITYYDMDIEDFKQQIDRNKSKFEQFSWDTPKKLWPKVKSLVHNTFLQSAIDCALWDIWGKMNQLQIHELWIKNGNSLPLGSFTLSGSPKGVAKKLREMNWPLYKIKMGTTQDDKMLKCIEECAGEARIIVDANGGWDLDTAKIYSTKLRDLGIKFIEQPLPPDQDAQMQKLNIPGIEWYADESAKGENAISKCAKYFDGINFKLMKSGGITPVLRGIEEARQNDLKISLGCMTESSFGISALAQLAPLVESIDMDGNLLIKNDPGKGVRLIKGKIKYGDGYGIGCRWR